MANCGQEAALHDMQWLGVGTRRASVLNGLAQGLTQNDKSERSGWEGLDELNILSAETAGR